jgi:hypothetical protein
MVSTCRSKDRSMAQHNMKLSHVMRAIATPSCNTPVIKTSNGLPCVPCAKLTCIPTKGFVCLMGRLPSENRCSGTTSRCLLARMSAPRCCATARPQPTRIHLKNIISFHRTTTSPCSSTDPFIIPTQCSCCVRRHLYEVAELHHRAPHLVPARPQAAALHVRVCSRIM